MTKNATPETLILIDGSSYLHRAFHALPPLTNSKGEPTGAVYGVLNMIRKLLNDYNPRHIVVVFDPKGKTQRSEYYPQYKATRPPMADELRQQIKPLHSVIRAMGLPLLVVDGEEADDVIGTLAKEAEAAGMTVLISTGDKDMAQLVNNHITLVNTMTGLVLNPAAVKEKFGVPPAQIVDYLALMGDSVDNVPGIPKVGPKTAVKWLMEYHSLENIIAHADKIPGKIGENLRESLSFLPLSKRLLTIRTDLPLAMHPHAMVKGEIRREELIEWFKRLEFKGWLAELLGQAPQTPDTEKQDYKTIVTQEQFGAMWRAIAAEKRIAFDTETTALNGVDAEIVGASFAVAPGQAFYVPVGHDYPDAPMQVEKRLLLEHIKLLLEDPEKIIIGQNLKYDINVLRKYGITLQAQFFDTMLESYVLSNATARHDMDSLALKYLGRRTTLFEDIAGKASKMLTCNQISVEKVGPYACQDADVTLQLHEKLWPMVAKEPKLQTIAQTIDFPLIRVLSTMECNGVLVDAACLQHLSYEFSARIKELEKEAHQLAGKKFNLGSTQQLQEVLYEKLMIPVQKKTPKGAPSTAEEVLSELAFDYPVPKIILAYRSLVKLKSTYADGLLQQISVNTGRVHTSYNQAVTSTGRLSSTNPNLQNIPVRTEEGRRIRQTFIAPPGHKIVAADYSQIELRIMAHLSQDAGLLKAFAQDADIHRATAAEVFGVTPEQVTSLQRRSAKAINFGLMYGMSAFGLSRQLGVDREVAQEYIDLYFSRYPGVKLYMEGIRATARRQGYVETLFGRRLFIPEINASNMQRRKGAERAAINGPMQGTAAEIIKIAMLTLDQWIAQSKLDVKMIMQVHDELVFEIAEQHVEAALPHIRAAMTEAIKLAVPVLVEIGVGNNWDEAH